MSSECIYPGPHGVMSEEDYMPVAFGRFKGCEPLRDRVCRSCNSTLSKAEGQLLRTGPAGFFRWLLGIEGRHGVPPSPFYCRHAGVEPILVFGRVPEFPYDLLWDFQRGRLNEVTPARQIVFRHPLGGMFPCLILDAMRDRPDLLRDALNAAGLGGAVPAQAFATPDEAPWVESLCRALGGFLPGGWLVSDFSAPRRSFVAKITATTAHFQAVAKIGFHYVLKMWPDLTGHERELERVKEFIWKGGDPDGIVVQRPDQFVINFRHGRRLTHWMHILAAERAGGIVKAYAQFFAGPHFMPPGYEIRLGRDPARILTRRKAVAHYFVYTNPTAPYPEPVGHMENAEPAEFICVPPR